MELALYSRPPPPGGGVLGLIFAGYVPLASQGSYPFKVYFLANYGPHLSHFLFMHLPNQCGFKNRM